MINRYRKLLTVDTQEALDFMTSLAEKVNTSATQDAYVYALVEASALKLMLGQTDAVRKDLDAANKILDTFDSVDPVIHAAFYRVSADYYSVSPHMSSKKITSRARLTIPTTIAMLSYILHVSLNLRRFPRKKPKFVHTISALLPSSGKRYIISANYYYILFSTS